MKETNRFLVITGGWRLSFRRTGNLSFLSFGELQSFTGAPFLDDEDWNSKDEESKAKNEQQVSLFDKL
jgi:hypothetical protein